MSNLTHPQRLAILHLANGLSMTLTAKKVNVTRQTITNWANDPNFSSELALAKEKIIKELGSLYSKLGARPVEVLKNIMEDKTAHNRDRIRAAVEIKNELHRFRETTEFEERLSKLEDLANREKNQNTD